MHPHRPQSFSSAIARFSDSKSLFIRLKDLTFGNENKQPSMREISSSNGLPSYLQLNPAQKIDSSSISTELFRS